MSSVVESYALIDSWIWTKLSGDSALAALVGSRIGADLVAVQWTGPYVTWNAQSEPRHIRSISGELLDTDAVYAVTAVTQGSSYASAAAIAGRVRELLDNQNVTVSGGSISCYIEQEIRLAEAVNGVPYRHIGWLCRIRAASI